MSAFDFVKGVWTDGHWVFSTGLDQRVRCWSLEEHGKLTERAHLIVSVPEPEALDARACTGWVTVYLFIVQHSINGCPLWTIIQPNKILTLNSNFYFQFLFTSCTSQNINKIKLIFVISRNHYQIAVAGRGMQIVEFSAPGTMGNGELGGSWWDFVLIHGAFTHWQWAKVKCALR